MNNAAVAFLNPNNPIEIAPKQSDLKPKANDVKFKDAIKEQKDKLQKEDDKIKDSKVDDSLQKDTTVKENDKAVEDKELKINKSDKAPKIDEETKLKEGLKLLEGAENEIMKLLAQYLQVDIETIEAQLQKLGIQPLQLAEPAIFSQFMTSVLGDDLVTLLGQSSQTKDIGKLFDTVEAIKQSVMELVPKEILAVLKENSEQAQREININVAPSQQQSQTEETIGVQPVVDMVVDASGEKHKHKDQKNPKELVSEGYMPKNSLGDSLTLPVHNLLEAQTLKMWQYETKQTLGVTHTNHAPINKQIMDQVDFTMLKDGKELTLDLAPKELGKLSIKISEHNGIVTTTIRVENEKTKEILVQNIEALKENLEAQGLKIGDFRVDVRHNNRQETMHKERQKSSKRIQEIIANHLEVGEVEENHNNAVSDGIHGEVDYMA